MTDRAWKRFERECATDLGTERIPVSGRQRDKAGADFEDGLRRAEGKEIVMLRFPGGVHICEFSALDELPKKYHSDPERVLDTLRRAGRFSDFEVTPAPGRTIEKLKAAGRLELDATTPYPWVRVVRPASHGAPKEGE